MLEQTQVARQSVTPQLIESSQILELSALELDQTIMNELQRNPALELIDKATCPRCSASLDGPYCPACHFDVNIDDERQRSERDNSDRDLEWATSGQSSADDFDPMTLVATDVSPVERLLMDVVTQVDEADKSLAEYLLFNLDARGFLEASLEEVSDLFGRTTDDVERVLKLIQQVAPPGVGARNVRESLLLQIDFLSRQGVAAPDLARRVVADHLDDLAAHRYSKVARRLGLSTPDIHAIHAFIRDSLTPSPLQTPDARTWRTPARAALVAPDVVVHRFDDELRVEIIESTAARLRLDPFYASLTTDLQHNNLVQSPTERMHLRQHVGRARLFLLALSQRHETLRRISMSLIEIQREYVLHGVRSLKPLTRGQVAENVGLHESTVSRATAGKYMMLPSREVIPFSTFFSASLSTKDIMREIIERENRAMTDEEIGNRLQSEGIRIARRTVAKYRANLGISPSTYRFGHSACREA